MLICSIAAIQVEETFSTCKTVSAQLRCSVMGRGKKRTGEVKLV